MLTNVVVLCVGLATLTLAGAVAVAEEPLQIVITSGRAENSLQETPAAASVIGKTDIHAARQQLGVDEVLNSVPGVFALNRYNMSQDLRLSVRGFGARSNFGIRGVRIFIDGVPATTPDGQSNVDDIDLASLQRMELLRGPAGALYGAAAGGVVSMETERGSSASGAAIRLAQGSYGFDERRAMFGGEWQHLDYAVNVSRQSLDGYRQQSASKRDLFNARFDYALLGGGELTTTFAVLDAPLAQDSGGLTATEVNADRRQAAPNSLRFDTGESVRQQRIGVSSRQSLSTLSELNWRVYGVSRDFSNRLPFNVVELDRVYAGTAIEYRRFDANMLDAGQTLIGLDLDYQDDDRRRRTNLDGVVGDITFSQQERVNNRGIFVLRQHPLRTRLRLDLGLRYDRLHISADDHLLGDGDDSDDLLFSQWSPSVALLWHHEATTVYARIATAFETPTTTELAEPNGGGGFNNGVQAETSISYELGARTNIADAILIETALFRIDVNDQLTPFEITGAPGRFAYENAGSSRNLGFETAMTIGSDLGWSGRLAFTTMDFRYIEFTDINNATLHNKRVPGIPRYVLNAQLAYRHAAGVYSELQSHYVGPYYADNANNVKIDNYVVTDLRLGFEKKFSHSEIQLFAGINNLFEQFYYGNIRLNATAGRYFEPAPPRHVYVGISLRGGQG